MTCKTGQFIGIETGSGRNIPGTFLIYLAYFISNFLKGYAISDLFLVKAWSNVAGSCSLYQHTRMTELKETY